eukprot:SAG31_NODE_6048_length_2192_cov_2.365504_4_plen_240_part_00
MLPGRCESSFGLHSNDGNVLSTPARRQKSGAVPDSMTGSSSDDRAKRFGTGDVVGCGFVFATRTLFWTINGKLHETLDSAQEMSRVFAAVGLGGFGTTVEVNLGESPFVFDTGLLPKSVVSHATKQRMDNFRAIGNAMGICLLHGGDQYGLRFPLYFCRHVYKFLLGRPITMSDYAYHSPESHPALLQMCTDAAKIAKESPNQLDEEYAEGLLYWDESVGFKEVSFVQLNMLTIQCFNS